MERYEITKLSEDIGKFKTLNLRDLLITRQWMLNGLFDNLEEILNIYNSGMKINSPTTEQKKNDTLPPYTDELSKPLNLSKEKSIGNFSRITIEYKIQNEYIRSSDKIIYWNIKLLIATCI